MLRRRSVGVVGDDRRRHLEFIQSTIGRMSSAAVVTKGWSLTIAIAAYGYAGTKPSPVVALLGIVAVLLFASVDAHYLREERKYRLLYDAVREDRVAVYEMNATKFCRSLPAAERQELRWSDVVNSWSVRDYYGLTALVGVATLVWSHCWA